MTTESHPNRSPLPTGHTEGSVAYVYVLAGVAALGGLLFGYDTAVISGAIGFLNTIFQLTPKQEGWVAASVLLGCAAGAALAGFISDYLGRKKMLALAGLMFLLSAIGTALPTQISEMIGAPWLSSITVFVIFRILAGLAIGAASVSAPIYIAEVSPASMRGRMVSINQFAIVTGILLTYVVNYVVVNYGNSVSPDWNAQYAWRWMFGAGAIPSIVLMALLLIVPESPRWLTKRGRTAEALTVLARVNGSKQAPLELATIERAIAEETGSLGQLLQPGLRFAMLIGVVLAVGSQFSGINAFMYFAPEIFKGMGWEVDASLFQTVIIGTCNLIFTIIAVYTVDRLGRKPLLLIGVMGIILSLLGLATAAYWGSPGGQWTNTAAIAALVCMVTYIACFAISLGPVCWVILSEIFPTSIRGRAMALATVVLWLADFAVTQTFPMMLRSEQLIATFRQAFPFLVYAAFCVLTFLFVWFYVPETKGKSLEEIEQSWMR
jgi:sugar porter (SP) family MFS transporter